MHKNKAFNEKKKQIKTKQKTNKTEQNKPNQ